MTSRTGESHIRSRRAEGKPAQLRQRRHRPIRTQHLHGRTEEACRTRRVLHESSQLLVKILYPILSVSPCKVAVGFSRNLLLLDQRFVQRLRLQVEVFDALRLQSVHL